MNKLGGWHRLFILLCVAWLLMVMGFSISIWPTSASPYKALERLPATDRLKIAFFAPNDNYARIDVGDAAVPSFYLDFSFPQDQLNQVTQRYIDAAHAQIVEDRRDHAFWTLIFLVAPLAILYSIGRSVGWVYRGFRPAV